MTYSTVEAFIQNEKIIFSNDFVAPKKNMKVLVTFIENLDEENINYDLYELDKGEVTDDLREKSIKALKKDKKLFTNI